MGADVHRKPVGTRPEAAEGTAPVSTLPPESCRCTFTDAPANFNGGSGGRSLLAKPRPGGRRPIRDAPPAHFCLLFLCGKSRPPHRRNCAVPAGAGTGDLGPSGPAPRQVPKGVGKTPESQSVQGRRPPRGAAQCRVRTPESCAGTSAEWGVSRGLSPWTRSLGTFSGVRESTSPAGARTGVLCPSGFGGEAP